MLSIPGHDVKFWMLPVFQIQRQPSPSYQRKTKLAMSHSVPEFAMTVSHEEDEGFSPIDQEGIVFGSGGSNQNDEMMKRKPSSNDSQQSKTLFG